MARERSERAEEILARNQLGILAERLGALEDAADHYRHALNLQRGANEGPGETVLLTNLARALRRLGDPVTADREVKRALALVKADVEPGVCGAAYREQGRIHAVRGRVDEACAALAMAGELFARAGWYAEERSVRLELGRELLDAGDARHAVAELSRASTGADRLVALVLLAQAYEVLEQPKNAITFRERAVELARRDPDVEARRILLEDAIAAADRLDRADLAAAWRSEHAGLSRSR